MVYRLICTVLSQHTDYNSLLIAQYFPADVTFSTGGRFFVYAMHFLLDEHAEYIEVGFSNQCPDEV